MKIKKNNPSNEAYNSTKNIANSIQNLQGWKESPSMLQGFYTHYHSFTKDGDELNVDFNVHKRLVRISAKLHQEPDKEYVSILKGGVILQEREQKSSRHVSLNSRFEHLGKHLSLINNPSLLQSIGNNYDVRSNRLSAHKIAYHTISNTHSFNFKNWIYSFFKNHMEKKRAKQRKRGFWGNLFQQTLTELFDFSIGAGAISFIHTHFSFTELSVFSGAYGLLCGAIDSFWRAKEPFLPKVAFFICLSFIFIYMQVQYRMWAIFL